MSKQATTAAAPLLWATRPGWDRVGAMYQHALAHPKALAPVPPAIERSSDFVELLTAQSLKHMPAHFSVRPEQRRIWGELPWMVPASVAHDPNASPATLLHSADYCPLVLSGQIFLFDTSVALPDGVIDTIETGLRAGWIQPIPDACKPGKLEPLPWHFAPPPARREDPNLDLTAFHTARAARWRAPVTAVIDWHAPEQTWLRDYPVLQSWLQQHAVWIEPTDVRLLQGTVQQLARPTAALTTQQVATLTAQLQGVLGEIAHRADIVATLHVIQRQHPTAILITERELSAPRGLQTSDAVIGVLDLESTPNTLHVLAAYELTSSVAAGTAWEQMAYSVDTRFAAGVTLSDATHHWRTVTAITTDATQRIVCTAPPALHETLRTTALDTATRALAIGQTWRGIMQPGQMILRWMLHAASAVIDRFAQRTDAERPRTAADFVVQLGALRDAHPALRPALEAWHAVAANQFTPGIAGRQTHGVVIRQLSERGIHASLTTICAWEIRLKASAAAWTIRPARLENLNAASQVASEALATWATALPIAERPTTPDAFVAALGTLAAAHPEAERAWTVVLAAAQNQFAPEAGRRQAPETIVQRLTGRGLQIDHQTILHWEAQCRTCAAAWAVRPARLEDFKIASQIASALLDRWAAALPKAQRPTTPGAFVAALEQLAADQPETALAWTAALAVARNQFTPGAQGRQISEAIARQLSTDGVQVDKATLRIWEARFKARAAAWKIQPARMDNAKAASQAAGNALRAWATALPKTRRPTTPGAFVAALERLAAAKPEMALAWTIILATARNQFTPDAAGRQTARAVARQLTHGGVRVGEDTTRSWESQLKIRAAAWAIRPARLENAQAASLMTHPLLTTWARNLPAGQHPTTPGAFVAALDTLAAAHPEAERAWTIAMAVAQHRLGSDADRQSLQTIATSLGAQGLSVDKSTVSAWEIRLRKLANDLGCALDENDS